MKIRIYLIKLTYKIKASTVILEGKGRLAENAVFRGTGAVRLPHYRELVTMIGQVNKPFISTSLNISGQKTLVNISDIEEKFGNQVDLILIDSDFKSGQYSEIFDIRDVDNIKQLR